MAPGLSPEAEEPEKRRLRALTRRRGPVYGPHPFGDWVFRCRGSASIANLARWQSGDAEDCKSLYAGSIPARASSLCTSL